MREYKISRTVNKQDMNTDLGYVETAIYGYSFHVDEVRLDGDELTFILNCYNLHDWGEIRINEKNRQVLLSTLLMAFNANIMHSHGRIIILDDIYFSAYTLNKLKTDCMGTLNNHEHHHGVDNRRIGHPCSITFKSSDFSLDPRPVVGNIVAEVGEF